MIYQITSKAAGKSGVYIWPSDLAKMEIIYRQNNNKIRIAVNIDGKQHVLRNYTSIFAYHKDFVNKNGMRTEVYVVPYNEWYVPEESVEDVILAFINYLPSTRKTQVEIKEKLVYELKQYIKQLKMEVQNE